MCVCCCVLLCVVGQLLQLFSSPTRYRGTIYWTGMWAILDDHLAPPTVLRDMIYFMTGMALFLFFDMFVSERRRSDRMW